jgi:hypothetical protein
MLVKFSNWLERVRGRPSLERTAVQQRGGAAHHEHIHEHFDGVAHSHEHDDQLDAHSDYDHDHRHEHT